MIRTLIAYTEEIDDVNLAVNEVKSRLGVDESLLKNTVGIIACHYEFVFSGVVKALTEALPFDVVGTITAAGAVPTGSGGLLLTLVVLTSDEAEFVSVLTPSLESEAGKIIEQSYLDAAAARDSKPALVLAFAPFMIQNSGDEYVNVLTKASGGVPVFGTLAVDDTLDFANCFMLHNGEHSRDQMAMLLIYGDIQPKFFIATISDSKILNKEALITSSEGHILKSLNDRAVVEFFNDLGLTQASETQYAMTSLPFMLDYHDGSPQVSKVFIGLTPEKYAICAGAMPEGATLRLGVFDKEDVLFTTGNSLKTALENTENASVMLIYSCISRNMTLGAESMAELALITELAGAKLPFMTAYSGGEICPTQITDGTAVNRFHNNALIGCIF
ncbi:MAG: FIST C-terminal domain-containing protein [Clostridiales Family XIII bacterium]|jgi:hypothetical protein|nr:FIST C-terminal domain-containing protein [Clostridiales Family XIII bacterium]